MQAKGLLFPRIRQVAWEEFEVPDTPGPYTIVAKASCSLISAGTELAIYSGAHIGFSMPNPPFPLLPNRPGYAFVGRIVAAGSEVVKLHVGQRVMMEAPHGSYAALDIREGTVVPLPDSVGDEAATLIRMADVAITAPRLAPVQIGEAVAVYGMGLVGNLAAQLYRLNGARPVFGIDQLPSRLDLAARCGLVAVDSRRGDAGEAILEATDGRGPEVVVEATGSPAVVPLALEMAADGGRVVLLGSTRGRVDLDVYSAIHRKGLALLGGHERTQSIDAIPHGRLTKARNLAVLADLIAKGDLRVDGLIGHRIAPSEAPAMYEQLVQRPQDYLGVLIDWTQM